VATRVVTKVVIKLVIKVVTRVATKEAKVAILGVINIRTTCIRQLKVGHTVKECLEFQISKVITIKGNQVIMVNLVILEVNLVLRVVNLDNRDKVNMDNKCKAPMVRKPKDNLTSHQVFIMVNPIQTVWDPV
jgi:hypothetical protein